MIKALVLVQTLVQIRLTATARPKEIPFMGLGVTKSICFTQTTHELSVTLEDFVQ